LDPNYLTVIEVLAIHAIVIDQFGGTDGVRDMGALEAAVFRPQTGYYDDPIAEAAALMESLIQNHPFLDGNKRTAVAAADVHLRLHGMELGGDSMDHHRFLIDHIESGELDRGALEEWIRQNVESNTFGSSPGTLVPPRDEWDRDTEDRARLRREVGKDLRSPLSAEEKNWLDRDLES